MARHLSARSVALTDQILAVLDDAAPLPMPTGYVIENAGLHGYNATVNRLLNRLARLGEVEKWPPDGDRRSCYWRRLGGLRP